MFKKAFFVVATFFFMFSVVAVILEIDTEKYNFITILDRVSKLEFPDVLNIFNRILETTKNTMHTWELNLPSWLSWLDNIASPFIYIFNLNVIIWQDAWQILTFIINFIGAILPFTY